MSEQPTLESWEIPSSLGIGVNYYYKDILRPSLADVERGASYTQNFIREHIARCDDRMLPHFKSIYDEGQSTRKHDRPVISWSGLFGILEDAGVSKVIVDQMEPFLAHAAYKRGNPIDFLQVKEFLAYCGIDGLYDFEKNQHFPVVPRVSTIPKSVLPEVWQSEGGDEVRLHVAQLMDTTDSIKQYDAEIEKLNRLVWGPYGNLVVAELNAGREVDDVSHRKGYIDSHPELAEPLARLEALLAAEKATIQEMKDKYAPMDKGFKLPSLGTAYDLKWEEAGEAQMKRRVHFKDRLQSYHKQNNIKSGDDNHIKFDWSEVKFRASAFKDWALRDFTMSKVNTGTVSGFRRHDIPRNFVQAVLSEKADGLLGIIKTPYRIEFMDDERNKFRIILNNTVVEQSSIDAVLELRAQQQIENAALAKANSELVKVHDIPPVEINPTVREDVPLNLDFLKGRTDIPQVTIIGDDEDLDEVERRMRLAKEQPASQPASEVAEPVVAEHVAQEAIEAEPAEEVVASAEAATPVTEEANKEASDAPQEVPDSTATLTGEGADSPLPAPPAPAEPNVEVSVAADETPTPPQASVPRRVVRKVDEEGPALPFPDSPVGFDDEKPNSEAAKPDDVAIQFNVVQPDLGLSQAPSPKTSPGQTKNASGKTPAADSGKPDQVKSGKSVEQLADGTPSRRNVGASDSKPGGHKDLSKSGANNQKGSISGDEALKRLLEMERQKALAGQRMPGMGGMGMGMGGMGGMNRFPPSYHVDFGLNTLFGGLRSAGSGLRNVFKSSSSAHTMDPAARAELLSSNADQLAEVRGILEAGTGANGQALSASDQEKSWTKLNSSIQGIDKATKGISKLGEGQMTDELSESLKKATRELLATKDLADKSAKNPGKIGEMAREAQVAIDTLTKALQALIKIIMRAFGKDKDNTPSI